MLVGEHDLAAGEHMADRRAERIFVEVAVT